ncbi:peptidase [Caldilinea sp.]|uniref:peptidase n=1 Tax=Caldilinea sp. TaxID=2293560 RepID=UPI002B6BE89D|nr:hypothetical protein [Caldilinea sp.]HRA65125.1 hypothetical protein [Caldilinea sp.]
MYLKDIQACVDRILEGQRRERAERRAVEVNPANAMMLDVLPAIAGIDLPQSLALVTMKLWKPGMTLRVRFLDGDPVIQQRLQPFAHVWSKHANLKFVFGNDPNAEIRISFKQRGSWSYIGTDCLGIPKNQATMNFGWLTRETDDTEYSRVVTHEFGHAVACIHEHQNPAANIPWDKPVVYRYYSGPPNNWTKDQVDVNLFQTYDRTQTQFSAFDPQSIMLYPIPNDFTIGDFEVGWNSALSDVDKQFVGTIYPFAQKPENALTIDGSALNQAIGAPGELDKFTFEVTKNARYRVETLGKQDLVMGLYGPDDEKRLVRTDDDSGVGLNPRIINTLKPGVYTVLVRHFSAKKTGDYQIQVKTEK